MVARFSSIVVSVLLSVILGCNWRIPPFNSDFESSEVDVAGDPVVVTPEVDPKVGSWKSKNSGTNLPSKRMPRSGAEGSSSKLLTWQAPGEGVERYYLEYGTSESNLDRRVEIPVSKLKKIDDPVYGPIFRYELRGVSKGEAIYFTLQAENQSGLSPKTPVQKLK